MNKSSGKSSGVASWEFMLMFLSPMLLLRSFLGTLRIVTLNYYGNVLRCCRNMLALQTVSNNKELCLNIFFLSACWGQERRRVPDPGARVASLWLNFLLFIVTGSDGGLRKKKPHKLFAINQTAFQVVLYLTVQIYLEQNILCQTPSCPFLWWRAPY